MITIQWTPGMEFLTCNPGSPGGPLNFTFQHSTNYGVDENITPKFYIHTIVHKLMKLILYTHPIIFLE